MKYLWAYLIYSAAYPLNWSPCHNYYIHMLWYLYLYLYPWPILILIILIRGLTPRLVMYLSQGAIFFGSYEFFKRLFCLEVPQHNAQRIQYEKRTEDGSSSQLPILLPSSSAPSTSSSPSGLQGLHSWWFKSLHNRNFLYGNNIHIILFLIIGMVDARKENQSATYLRECLEAHWLEFFCHWNLNQEIGCRNLFCHWLCNFVIKDEMGNLFRWVLYCSV